MSGLRATYPNSVVEGTISVYDGIAEGLDVDGGRWSIVCETHGTILAVARLADAKTDARSGVCDFCEECMDLLVAQAGVEVREEVGSDG